MNILVTGTSGFIGRYLRENTHLSKRHKLIYGTTTKGVEGTVFFEKCYSNIDEMLKEVEIDSIIHLAAVIPTSFSNATFEDVFLPNIQMMNNLYNFSIQNRIKKFIYISGFGSMLNPPDLDIKDFYTMSKICGEHFCKMMESNGIHAVSLRISAPYGEYSQARNVINIFISNALRGKEINVYGSGKREQNFTYVGDVLQAIELCVDRDVSGVYEIVSQKNTSMLELADIICELIKSSSVITIGKTDDPQENYRPRYDYFKAFKAFGYKPKYDIRSGLSRYIDWIIKNEVSFDF